MIRPNHHRLIAWLHHLSVVVYNPNTSFPLRALTVHARSALYCPTPPPRTTDLYPATDTRRATD